MKQIISLMSLFVFLSLPSCVSKPPDGPMCRNLKSKITMTKDEFGLPVKNIRWNPVCEKEIGEASCGRCTWTISDKVQYVGEGKLHWLYGKPWSQVQDEAVICPSEHFAQLKAYTVKSCKKINCDKEIPRWQVKLDALDSVGMQPKP